VITPGDGVTVTGNGSPTRPYEIGLEVESSSLDKVLDVNSTPTLTLASAGSGTPTDKFTIYGYPTLKLTQLTDVLATDIPANNEVPTWVTDHWEFKAVPYELPPGGALGQVLAKNSGQDRDVKWMNIPSGPPTTVTTGNGISGDGSAGTPVIAKHSGVWGSNLGGVAPLDIFGPAGTGVDVNSYGPPVYIDAQGNLRVQPLVISGAVANRLAADLNDKYPIGPSVLALTGAQAVAGGWPGGSSAIVLTMKRDASYASQLWQRNNVVGANYTLMYRTGDLTSWGPWLRIPVLDPALTMITNAFSASTNFTINNQETYLLQPNLLSVYLDVKYTGAGITVPTTGDVTNTKIVNFDLGATYVPLHANWALPTAPGGRVAAYDLTPAGIYITAAGGTVNIATNEVLSCSGIVPLKSF
jgi:hypothetical protein